MINRYTGSGRLTADPELRTIVGKDGQSVDVVRIRLAVDRMGRSGATGYINVDEYGPGAKAVAEHMSKGSYAAVDGRLEWREWQDGERKRDALSVVGHIDFGPKVNSGAEEREQSEEQALGEISTVENDPKASSAARPSRETVTAVAGTESSAARVKAVAHPLATAAVSAVAPAGMGL
jgi:single stranded DNA-binding protein